MRLRQLALVTRDFESTVAELTQLFALGAPFADPGVATFGLRNAVFPIGDVFLEVVSPDRPDTSAGRFLARRGGDGGYMVIVQTDDRAEDAARVEALGVRVVWEAVLPDISTQHLHPRDVGGAILSLDVAVPAESWRWAGPGWRERSRTDAVLGIDAVDLQAPDPVALADRWSGVLGRRVERRGAACEIPLDDGTIRFVEPGDDRGEGIAAIDLRANDRAAVLARARERGNESANAEIAVCGTRFRLV